MTGMDDLVTWLRAQMDADERDARMATATKAGDRWRLSEDGTVRGHEGSDWVAGPHPMAAPHIARWDPARVLAEVDAKRRMLDLHAPVIDGSQDSWAWFQGSESVSLAIVKLIALPYADRPGYQEEWRPA